MSQLQTIEFYGFSVSLWGLLFYGIILFVAVGVLISVLLKISKANSQIAKNDKQLREEVGERMLCINCPYCKKRYHKPFHTNNHLASYEPIYCRRFKMSLPTGRTLLVCQANDPRKAMRVKKG